MAPSPDGRRRERHSRAASILCDGQRTTEPIDVFLGPSAFRIMVKMGFMVHNKQLAGPSSFRFRVHFGASWQLDSFS